MKSLIDREAQPSHYRISPRKTWKVALIIFLPLFFGATCLVSCLWYVYTSSGRQVMEAEQEQAVQLQKEQIEGEIRSVVSDLMYVAGQCGLADLFQKDGTILHRARTHLENEFLLFSGTRKLYDQVRILDEKGLEVVRVNFNSGQPAIVPEEKLQNKKGRYYFDDTIWLKRGEVFVSPLDLNMERGQIEKPLKPMIRFGTPVFDQEGRKRGIALLNFLGAHLLQRLAETSAGGSVSSMLLNQDGYYLKGREDADEWGFMFKDRKERSFSRQFSKEWAELKSGGRGQFETAAGLFTFASVHPLLEGQRSSSGSGEAFAPSTREMAARDYFWPVVSLLPDDVPYAERNAILRWGIAALGMLGMILGPVCWQLARARLMRLRADELTHRSEVRLRNIHETASDAIITGDSRGKISGWNQGAENIFGYEENEAVGKPLTLIMPDRFHEAHEKGLERYVKTHETRVVGQTVELVGRRKCGEEFPVELSLNFWVTSEGEFFTGILRDISSRKEVEDQLREARRSAEAASIAKSDFLANMSHEIRTPMNGIIGMTDLLMDTALSDEQHDYLKMARDSGHALLHIINEILDFSKIEAGKLEITPANFSLRHCIGDTLKLLAQRSDEKELELLWDMPHEIPDALNGDPGRIRQILTNLIGNAIKFTEEGEILVRVAWKEGEGSVEGLEDGSGGVVEASGLKSSTSTPPSTHEPMPPSRTPTLPHSRASTHQKSVNLHFSVKDTGIGIPKEEQQAVFDSFTQVDSSSTRSHGGTGLGLAISSRLVSLMGGQIWLESETGTGSTFHFSLPLALQEYPRKRIITRQMQTLREISALVVDDNATNRRILQGLLGKWHMPTTIVGSGQAALQAIAQACNDGKPFGVAILDSQMPGMDGFMLAERIQEDRGLKTPRLILLTSAGRPGDAERCRSLGIDAYLHKPINPSDLQDAILLVTSSEDKEDQPREVITQHSLHEAKRAYRVLLAEDNEINQLLATRLLENHGYSVVLANNGREAVDAFQQEPFDVILMDVRMPEMDGFQATAAIRELEANGNHPLEDSNQKTPIIALTAHAMEGDREKCIEAGMDEHVSKPITPDKLFRVINRLLAKEQETSDQQVEQLPSTTGSIDLKAIMDRTEGDMELAREVIQVFIDASDRLITEMDDCFAEGDAAALRDTAHSIKGSAGNFGAGRVSQAASELEIAAGQKELIGASAKLNQLKEEMVELVCELKQFMNGDSS